MLVVYQPGADVPSIRKKIEPHALRFPLDVTYMSETEEKEFNFIQEQRAKPLQNVLA
jgi:hypothetical protein